MAEWNAEEDPYAVLGIGFESTKDDLKKKYRRLVLEKHPDKQPGNKKAADEFIKIQRAYEILTDEKAKAAFDALHKAKQAREAKQAGQSEKRRKMAADLEKREREYDSERQQEKAARNKLNAELARLRKEMAEKEAERQAVQLRERVAASLSGTASSSQQASAVAEETHRTLKASWDASAGAYTEERLRAVFGEHGEVEDVIVRQSKKRGKCSAVIVMRSLKAAVAAADAVSGDLENPLLVVPLAKVSAVGQPGDPQSGGAKSAASLFAGQNLGRPGSLFPGSNPSPLAAGKPLFAAFSSSATDLRPSSHGSSHTSYESDILAKMRRKAEEAKKQQQP